MVKDPVCNMTVDEKKAVAKSVYKGKTYYFCAKVCKEKFDKEPERFIAKERE
ncbi:MAG: YHS domain-containing protein [Thermodesulfovibrionales bacterium]